jgi:hypothetical protein
MAAKRVSVALLLMAGMPLTSAPPALAASSSSSGYSALAFGVIVGGYSPALSTGNKTRLARLLENKTGTGPARGKITINANSVVCRASNVAIAAFGCQLTFGTHTVTLSGRRANELFAVIGEMGVPGDGAAGTIYEALHAVSCTIDPVGLAQKGGGGADCSFEPGPA